MHPPLPPLDAVLARLAARPPGPAAEAARTDQADRWAAGQRVLAERYLKALPAVAASPEDALVIVYGEVLLRTDRGEAVDADAFLARFPAYRDRIPTLFEVHQGMGAATEDTPAIPGYEHLELAGHGGMGTVYRAVEAGSGRAVAIKVLRAGGLADPAELARFHQEADILARLDHPNVVRFLGRGSQDGQPYLVTEWIDGGTLAGHLGQPADPAWAVAQVRGIAAGLAAAHAAGVIHRDVKPGNVLLANAEVGTRNAEVKSEGSAFRVPRSDFRVAKLADFGLARLLGSGGLMTATGDVLGTRRYMPPEQIDGRAKDVGPWSDLFSLGAIFFELLTGQPAFPERDTPAGLAGPFRPAPEGVVGRPWEAVCRRALQPEPPDRYPTAAALIADLDRWADFLS